MSSGELSGKTAIVTGGARGIGRGIVEAFVEAGAFVFIADLDREEGEAVAGSLGSDRARFVATDVSDEAQIESCIRAAHRHADGLGILVNNAGIGDPNVSIEALSADSARQSFDVILLASMLATKHAVPCMRERGGGVVLNTASVRGVVPAMGGFVYSALKAAMIHWTKIASQQLAADHIRINCVSPGGIPTALVADEVFPDGAGDGAMEQIAEMMRAGRSLARAGGPSDIAAAMLFLAGEGGSWITGQNFVVDGGYCALAPLSPG